MDKVIDLAMTKLFQLAEYICNCCPSIADEPAATKEAIHTIRFTNEDKAAVQQAESNVCIRPTKRKQTQLNIKMVEGELFQN